MPNIDVKFLRGDQSDLSGVTKTDGQFIVAVNDDQDAISIYADIKDDENVVQRMPLDLSSKGDNLAYDSVNNTLKLKSGDEVLSVVSIQGGGGLQIGNVIGATATVTNTTASLTWTDPSDIIADGVTLAEWAGTLVLKKVGSAPENSTDGVTVEDSIVRNQHASTPLQDTGLAYDTTVYYRFFPYTTDNVYRTGTALSVTPRRTVIENIPSQSGTLTYDGTEKTASFSNYDPNKLTATNITKTNAGTYTATFTPKADYCWSDGTQTPVNVSWTIDRATLAALPGITSSLIWTGSEIVPTWDANYDSDKMTRSGDTSGTDVKTYITTFTPKANYQWWDGSTTAKSVEWAIVYQTINVMPSQSNTLIYSGAVQTPTWSNYDTDQLIWSGDTSGTDADTYTATFTPKTGYSWSDGTVSGKNINWTISKQPVTAPAVTNKNKTYNGASQSPTIASYDNTIISVSGNSATNAGNYTVVFTLIDDDNYDWTDTTTYPTSVAWTIAKAQITKPTAATSTFTYDGTAKSVVLSPVPDSNLTTLTNGTKTAAGSYTATLEIDDKDNYEWASGGTIDAEYPWTINKATLTIPTVNASVVLTYSGNEINAITAGKFNDYDSTKMSVSGHTATNAGSYTAVFSLIDSANYQWTGNIISDRNVSWGIEKAQGSITLVNPSQSSVTLDDDHASVTVNFTKFGDGTISRSVADSSICTATLSGNSVVIATVDETSGETTVTLTLAATTNYKSATLDITVVGDYARGVPWATGTDAEIVTMIQLADQGKLDPREYWSVGQERTFSLSAMSATGVGEAHVAQNVTMVLVDKDNQNYTYVTTPSSGRTYPYFIVQQKNGLANGTSGETGYMNSTATNSGSWDGCARRTWCNNVYKPAVASSIRDIFHQVKVKTAQTYNGSSIKQSDDYFFLPAEREIFDSKTYSNQTEWDALTQWDYYKTAANRIKNQGNSGSAHAWWERSPHSSDSRSFCLVYDGGTATNNNAGNTRLIAPAGCI